MILSQEPLGPRVWNRAFPLLYTAIPHHFSVGDLYHAFSLESPAPKSQHRELILVSNVRPSLGSFWLALST